MLAGSASAQLPLIRLDRIFPLGGAAGAEVEVELTGRDLDDAKTLAFDHPGLKATFLKSNHFKIAVAADTPPGSYELRAVGRFGISGTRLFAVSRGLTEVRDSEPNDSPDKAQVIPMNCVVNGTSDNNGDDFFLFPAKKGERVTVDCQAFRLDSTLRAILSIATTDGRQLAQSRPYYHRTDPLLDFVAPADGSYVLRLHDATFSGGLPYRLVVSTRPHIESAYPSAVRPGEKTSLTLLGRNLPGGTPVPQWSVADRALEQLVISFSAEQKQGFASVYHLTSPNVAARGLQFWPAEVPSALNPVTVAFADAPIVLEHEPNDSADHAQPVTLPAVICGRFDRPGDGDWYTFTAKNGEAFRVDLLCERIDLPGDPYVILFDTKGNELQAFDDHGINVNALVQFNRDPLGTFRVPADGTYRIFVQERYRNGGARYQYVLRMTKAEPDFFPVAIHATNDEPTCPCIGKGGSAFCEICMNRRDFSGPITVEAEGLPAGVSCPAVHISPQTEFAPVVFSAAADAPEWAGPVRLKAWAQIDGKRVEREVRCVQRRWHSGSNASVAVRQICLAVREQAPYAVHLPAEKQTVAAGKAVELKASVVRQWPDFKGKVQLNGVDLPPGFTAGVTEIAADQNEVVVKLTIADNVPPGDYTVVFRGDAQVPYNRDRAATNRPNVRVADPSTPAVITVTAPAKK